MSASTLASARVVRLLYWQVTHQAAVKSTNTGRPSASSSAWRSALQGCQLRPCTVVATGAPGVASAMRVTLGPTAQPSHSRPASDKPASAVRLLPRKPSDHTSSASTTSSMSRAAAPSMPLCCPSTHSSHTTVANMGKAMSWRKVFIQAPGRGSARAMAGHQLAAR